MRKIHFFTAFLLILGLCANAQTKGLKVGGEFRHVILPKVLNGNQRSFNTADFKDKLLIIDFWATSCAGCVAALPKMEALQKEFSKQVKIIPVTFEPEALVATFWKRNKYTKSLNLPTVIEDSIMKNLFPHEVIPHEIWIYKGKVIGITSEEYVDAFNIRQVLDGKIPNWVVKDDYYTFDGIKKHLLRADEKQIDLGNTKMEYAATCGYLDRDGASAAGPFGSMGIVRDSVLKMIRTYHVNEPIFNIYMQNWGKLISLISLVKPEMILTANQIVWDVADPAKYMFKNSFTPMVHAPYIQDWKRDHAICFESQYADTGQTDKDVAKKVIKDLNWLLGLNVRWEKRKEKVLVVVRTGKANRKPAASADKMLLYTLISEMNNVPGNPYVFNETKKEGEIELATNINTRTDITSIKKALNENGLDLKEEERMVDKFVFSEIDGGLIVDAEKSKMMIAQMKVQENMPVPTTEEGLAFLQENKKKKGVTTLPSGLQYEVLKTGNGSKPVLTDKVLTQFMGKFVNGKIFDSSYQGGLDFATKLTDVVSGWTEALQLMSVGSEWRIYLPAELAYGATGSMNVPPGSVLVFDIKLIKIL